ncbi:exosome component Rrp46 [Infundibulicybe gibba]|nr:exosome component Rrp46 [Infundibulicybe gibba]
MTSTVIVNPTIVFPSLSRTDGSAQFTFSNPTPNPIPSPGPSGPTALASVTGPIEARIASEHPSQLTLELTVRPLSHVSATAQKTLASKIRCALLPALILPAHPRTLVQVVVQELVSTRGSSGCAGDDVMLSAMINATMLSLLDAGSIPLRGVVCAVPLARLPQQHDSAPRYATHAPATIASGCFAFLFEGASSEPACVWASWGSATPGGTAPDLEEAQHVARGVAKVIWREMKVRLDPRGTDDEMEV